MWLWQYPCHGYAAWRRHWDIGIRYVVDYNDLLSCNNDLGMYKLTWDAPGYEKMELGTLDLDLRLEIEIEMW